MKERIAKEHHKLEEFREYSRVYDDAMKEGITKRIDDLNEDLKVRQESIDLLKGRLRSQITSFHEKIAKVLDKNTSLGEKIRNLFRDQGIAIASILTAIHQLGCRNRSVQVLEVVVVTHDQIPHDILSLHHLTL